MENELVSALLWTDHAVVMLFLQSVGATLLFAHDSIQAEKIDTQTIVVWLKGVTDIFFVASLSIQKSRDDVRPLLSESD